METVLYKLLTKDKQARLLVIDNTAMIEQAAASLNGFAAELFSSLLTFACILHGLLTNAKRITVKLETQDPSSYMVVGADANGDVQGYMSDEMNSGSFNSLKEITADGGCLKIIYDNGADAVVTGVVEITGDNIEDNLSRYYLQSEQTESLYRYFAGNDSSTISRGIFVQALPFADKDLMTKWSDRMEECAGVIAQTQTPIEKLIDEVFFGADVTENWPIRYRCSCDRQSVLFMLMGLGTDDLEFTISENNSIEVKCGKCGEKYSFGADEIKQLIDMIGKKG